MPAFAKFPGKYSRWPCGFSRLDGLVQCEQYQPLLSLPVNIPDDLAKLDSLPVNIPDGLAKLDSLLQCELCKPLLSLPVNIPDDLADSVHSTVSCHANLCLSSILHTARMPGGSDEVSDPRRELWRRVQMLRCSKYTLFFFFVFLFLVGFTVARVELATYGWFSKRF